MSNLLTTYNPFKRRTLTGQLDIRRAREADIEFTTYIRPQGRFGLHIVRRTCNDQEITVGSALRGQTFAPGTQIPVGSETGSQERFIIGTPPPGRRGSSVFGVSTVQGETVAVGITAAVPNTLDAGSTGNIVRLEGFGYLSTDQFRAVIWEPVSQLYETDPLITLSSPTFIDPENFDITVDVSAGAPTNYSISIEVTR